MLLTMAFILAIGSAFVEFVIVKRVKPLQWLNERSQLAGFIISVLISFVLGSIFGMAGLVVGIAAVLSSMMTEPVWYLNRKARESGSQVGYWYNETRATYKPVLKGIKIALVVALAPIWVPVKVRQYLNEAKGSP